MPRSFIIIIPLHRHSTLLSLSPLSYSPGSSKLWLYLVMSLSSFMRPSRQMRLVKTHNYTNWPPFIFMIPDFKWTLSTIQQSDYIFKVHLLSPCPEMLLPTFSSLLKLPLTLHSQPMVLLLHWWYIFLSPHLPASVPIHSASPSAIREEPYLPQ